MILSLKVYKIVTTSSMIGTQYFVDLDKSAVATRSVGGAHGNDYSALTKDLSWQKLNVSLSDFMDSISAQSLADKSANKGIWR